MQSHLIFVGTKFIYNELLYEYILRAIKKEGIDLVTIDFYKESDTSFLLNIQNELKLEKNLLIITTKQNFSTVGKVLCTLTQDNQILKDNLLIPSASTLYSDKGYLLEYEKSKINVFYMDEGEKFPKLFLNRNEMEDFVHIFEEKSEELQTILMPLAQMYDVNFEIIPLIDGWIKVRISSNKYGDISKFIHAAKKLLPKKLIAASNIFEHIIKRLEKVGKKITFAESCTGGLLSYYFTKHNGASKILDGSLVTYSNGLKENWLAVSDEILKEYGAVSAEVVREMSEGALNVSGADYALAVSGIAGDGGGTQLKPVGTVYIGVRTKTAHFEQRHLFCGDRNYIQHQSVLMAVLMMLLLDKETFF
jgi:nicotinamide-nucleotide amidase